MLKVKNLTPNSYKTNPRASKKFVFLLRHARSILSNTFSTNLLFLFANLQKKLYICMTRKYTMVEMNEKREFLRGFHMISDASKRFNLIIGSKQLLEHGSKDFKKKWDDNIDTEK